MKKKKKKKQQQLSSKKSTGVLKMMKKKLQICSEPKKMETTGFFNIDEDTVTEILMRLPTKSIFKFKCVSKTWLKIINSPWFANFYKSFNGVPVLAGFFHVNQYFDLNFHPVNHRLKSPSVKHHLPLNLQGLSVNFMSSSNGFLLLGTSDGRQIVHNPVTGRRLMIPGMVGNQEWHHAFGLIHEKDNHVKVVFAYKLATDIQTALEIDRFTRDNEMVDRHELPSTWLNVELLAKWKCKTKEVEFRVYCSKKNEWNCNRLVSKFPKYVCFNPEQKAGVSVGGDLYWMTVDGSVLGYNSESEAAELIGAPSAKEGLETKSMHCNANGILVYCARDRIRNEVVIWELSNSKTWVPKEIVKLHALLQPLYLKNIFYVCHEMQAVYVQMLNLVCRFGFNENKLKHICTFLSDVDRVTPYLMSTWPAALNGDEAWPSSSSSSSSSSDENKSIRSKAMLAIHYRLV